MARTALVTGGTRGIGEAISVKLRDAGCKVAANYGGNDERAREFSERTGIAAYRFDVGDFDAVKDGIARIEADLGPVDVLVNNAGITKRRNHCTAWSFDGSWNDGDPAPTCPPAST